VKPVITNVRLAAINLLLATLAAMLLWKRQQSLGVETAAPLVATNTVTAVEGLKARLAAGKDRYEAKFSYRTVLSPDYQIYITNLRAIHCPEETIQDIIIAAVNKDYAHREAALKLLPHFHHPWEGADPREARDWDRVSKLRELRREKQRLLKELLGVNVVAEMPLIQSKQTHERLETALNFLPEYKRETVRDIQERFWEQSQQLRQRTLGYLEAEDHAEYGRLRKERQEALARLLTPQEFDDLEMRTSTTASALRNQIAAFNPSEKEFREIFKLKSNYAEEFSTLDGAQPDDLNFAQKRAAAAQLVEEQIKSTLGPERYADYQRSQDGMYQNLARVVREAALPQDAALKGYEIQKAAMEEMQRTLQTPELSNEQRQEALNNLRQQTEAALQQVLGQDGFKRIQRQVPVLNMRLPNPSPIRP